MGSTRMSADPREGVVDPQCRVHGISNLYVAGGSVLPRAGVMMVTYNLLALALRLGDHLKRTLRQ
jgi:choline dehydrogenase-like flavoprotein